MRILGVTQGSNLKVFLRLLDLLRTRREITAVAAFVADSMVFRSLERSEPTLCDGTIALLNEWEITSLGRHRRPNWGRVAEWERTLGDPVLWNALLADRRLFFGRRCKQRQDYRPRFDHIELGGILETALERCESFFDQQRPDLVLGFGSSTIGDYLCYRFAKARGIAYLQLKATKVGNRVSLNDDAVKLSAHVADAFENQTEIPAWCFDGARVYLEEVRERGVRYEGAIQQRHRHSLVPSLTALVRGLAIDLRRLADPVIRGDNHTESIFLTHWHERFRNPFKGAWIERRLGVRLLGAADLERRPPFAFYPLHFEPEVSLQIFGRPFQNQIEVARALAASLPMGMELLVKEHPRARGFRPWAYYRKLLEIPNVRLVKAELSTHMLVNRAALVAVISGSTGLEAAICGRPVITFGTPVYNLLRGNMIRPVGDLNNLAWEVRDLLANHYHDEPALERYIAATIAGAVPVDLYTTLLGKTGRIREGREEMSEEQRRSEDYERLATYCDRRIDEVLGKRGGDGRTAGG